MFFFTKCDNTINQTNGNDNYSEQSIKGANKYHVRADQEYSQPPTYHRNLAVSPPQTPATRGNMAHRVGALRKFVVVPLLLLSL